MTEAIEEKRDLKGWREHFGLTQKELASLAGLKGYRNVSNVERGTAGPNSAAFRAICEALELRPDQVSSNVALRCPQSEDWEDGYGPSAPRQALRAWREQRLLSQPELAYIAGISATHIHHLETGRDSGSREIKAVKPRTRWRLARALRVDPAKLVLPGDPPIAERVESQLDYLRAELRGARHAAHKLYDLVIDNSHMSFKGQDARDNLLPEIQRELKGT